MQIAVAERMSGVPARLLRHYHRRGWFVPSEVDPRTGHRRYSRQDVRRLRLLGYLRSTGLPAAEAARIAAEGDRQAVLDHLAVLERAGRELRALLPPARSEQVITFRWPAEPMAEHEVPAGDGETAAVSAFLARVAVARGCGVDAFWAPVRAQGVPEGPVLLRREDGDPAVLCLPAAPGPWPPGTTVQTWPGVDVRACRVQDGLDTAAAHRVLDDAVGGDGMTAVGSRREVLGHDLRCRLVAAPVLRLVW